MSSVVPEGWSRQKLGDSLIPRPKSKLPSGESNPLGYYDFYVCSHKVLKSFHDEYSSPSILFSTGGEASVHLATERYAFSTDVWATEFEGDICNEYVFRLLEENIRTINYSGFQGSGIKHLDKSFIEKLEFSIPPLPEQKKIASILTSVDEVIENTQKQIDKLQDLKKATMNELLTKGIGHTEFKDSELGQIPKSWLQTTIGKLAKVKRGASPRPIQDPKWWGGSVGWTRISDVTSSTKYLNNTKDYLSSEGVKKSVQIDIGEVILSICATIGRPIIVNSDVCIHDGFVWFEGLSDNVDREFYYYTLCLKEQQLASSKQTGTQGNLNTDIVSRLKINLPPLLEQKKIASIITSMDKIIEENQRKLAQTESLKKSLMQDLLTGKVRVTVN